MSQLSTNISVKENAKEYNVLTEEKVTFFWYPILLLLCVVIIDQWTKYLVVVHIRQYTQSGEVIDLFNGFIWIIKVFNKGIAFSMASDTHWWIRLLVVYIVPMLLILYLLKIVLYSNFRKYFRWYAALVSGGGIGNLIDRFFREEGVVDFISVNTYNFLGMSRWATFNIADVSVVIGMLLWIITLFAVQRGKASPATVEDTSKVFEENTIA